MTIRRSAPRSQDLRDWMLCHVAVLTDAGAAAWHVLRAQMIAAGFDAFLEHGEPSPGVTLNAEAAADVERESAIAAIADEFVAAMFRNGQGNTAARLEQIDGDGRMQGGWGPGPFRDRVLVVLREASRSSSAPTSTLEAIQDEEAILRIGLAFKAAAASFRDSEPSGPELCRVIGEMITNPDLARQTLANDAERDRRSRRIR